MNNSTQIKRGEIMKDDKMVMQITLKDIVENSIDFCLNNNIFDKYVGELRQLNQKLEDTESIQEREVEKLSGYNNAVINVLKLVNPIYEYKLD